MNYLLKHSMIAKNIQLLTKIFETIQIGNSAQNKLLNFVIWRKSYKMLIKSRDSGINSAKANKKLY